MFKISNRIVALAAIAFAVGLVAFGGQTALARGPENPGRGALPPTVSPRANAAVCDAPIAPETARCLSRVVTEPVGAPDPSGRGNSGLPNAGIGNGGAYDPRYLQVAYGLQAAVISGGTGTVAIIDAYDNPRAETDLASYRSFFGLPACTTANGCFRKVNQRGAKNYPRPNAGWGLEIALDLDMVSAVCPRCKILLVEADSASFVALGTAVNYAASQADVVAISNSYGANEFSSEAAYDGYYNHPGKAITVSSGDSGYGVEYPAASPYVTAVGGTHLVVPTGTATRDASVSETVWSGAGSGCSAFEAKPAFQKDAGCARRTVADVAAVADPSTGVWVYDTYGYRGWYIVGGTSASAPIIAGIYALANNGAALNNAYPYGQPASFYDITAGTNGSCGGTYLCTGLAGYDGPTGVGTPNGTGGF